MSGKSTPIRIGFLPFYVGYYESICPTFGEEKVRLAKRCAARLAAYGDVVWDQQLIVNPDSAAAAGKLLRGKVDAVVVVCTIAVFGSIPMAAIDELEVPILIWNAQEIESVSDGYSMVEIVRNTGQIGTQALANSLLRAGREFSVFSAYVDCSVTDKSLKRFFAVASTIATLKNAKLLAIGSQFPGMTDIALDESYLREHLGATVTRISTEKLTQAYDTADVQLVDDEKQFAALSSEVAALADDALLRSVRLSVAVESLVCEHEADAGTLNCHLENCLRNPAIGVTACYSLGVQNGRGRPFTCTGDLPTALAMLLLKSLTGVAMYTEVQVLDGKRGAVVIANSGEGEDGIRIPNVRSRLVGNTNFSGLHGRGASYAYPLQPGPATLVSLTPTPHGANPFRLIAAEGEILNESLPDAGALAGFFRFHESEVHDGYRRWLEAGPVHHAATSTGHWGRELHDVAKHLDFEFVKVS